MTKFPQGVIWYFVFSSRYRLGGCLDDLLHDVAPEGLKGHLLRVLDRDNNGVNPDWHAGAVVEVIFTSDLCLGIRPRPPEGAVAAHVCYLAVQRVGEGDCEGHALLSLVCGVPKHEALVTGPGVVLVPLNV